MNLQEELKTLKERIVELEELAKEEQEFPQQNDKYWYIEDDTDIMPKVWWNNAYEQSRLSIGNVYKTKEQAEFTVEKLKVEAELRKFSRPFEEDKHNYFMVLDTCDRSIDIWGMLYSNLQGTIYFESEEKVQQAIYSVGEERIKKYIFGVED